MKDRLIWILSQLQKLQDDDRVRSDGNSVFIGAKSELTDVIATYAEPAPAAPATVSTTMTPDDIAALVAGMVKAVTHEIEVSDTVTLAAIHESQKTTVANVLAGIAPAPAAA